MGLDMYLDKAKRLENASAKDIEVAEDYLGYLLRPSEYAGSTMEDWCGTCFDEVKMDIVDAYRGEYQTRYYAWDTEKVYKHLGLFDGVAYWRKANHIHGWFVENVQDGEDDCGTYEITRAHLQNLLDCCCKVKDASHLVKGDVKNGQEFKDGKWQDIIEEGEIIEDPMVAMELLPVKTGFFFGSCNYDRWYLNDIEYTIGVLEDLLEKTDFDKEVITYHAGW